MRVKLAGDGAVMTRQTSFQLFSFSLLNWGQDVLSPSRVRTIAVVAGQESYETLRDGMKDVFQEVNDMVEEKKIDVDGKTIELDFYLCGDMKFKQKVLGLQGATANYACIRCKVEKEERYVVTSKSESGQGPHMQKLINQKEIGISFAVWLSRKACQDLDFTSLMGPAKRKMIQKLPEKFDAILRPETCAEVKWLWEEFSWLFDIFSSWKPALEDLDRFWCSCERMGFTVLCFGRPSAGLPESECHTVYARLCVPCCLCPESPTRKVTQTIFVKSRVS